MVWFGFFGSFLIGASWRFLHRYPGDRLIGWYMLLYGLLFFAYYPALSGRHWLKRYCLIMALGALGMSARLGYVAVKRPSTYSHWDDWLLLAFLLLGMWSLVAVLWFALARNPAAASALNARPSGPPTPAQR